jgi:hypothetical protein
MHLVGADHRRALRGKRASAAHSVCNFVASALPATCSSSARCRTGSPAGKRPAMPAKQGAQRRRSDVSSALLLPLGVAAKRGCRGVGRDDGPAPSFMQAGKGEKSAPLRGLAATSALGPRQGRASLQMMLAAADLGDRSGWRSGPWTSRGQDGPIHHRRRPPCRSAVALIQKPTGARDLSGSCRPSPPLRRLANSR